MDLMSIKPPVIPPESIVLYTKLVVKYGLNDLFSTYADFDLCRDFTTNVQIADAVKLPLKQPINYLRIKVFYWIFNSG